MEIPSVTEKQVQFINLICITSEGIFSQRDPSPTDSPEDAETMREYAEDAKHLLELGFIEEISKDHQDQLDKMKEATGHTWHVFKVTAMGKAMFQAAASPGVN